VAPYHGPQADRDALPGLGNDLLHHRRLCRVFDPHGARLAARGDARERDLQQDFQPARHRDGVLLPRPGGAGDAGELRFAHHGRGPRLGLSTPQPLELVRLHRGRPVRSHGDPDGRRGYGLDFLHALLLALFEQPGHLGGLRSLLRRLQLHLHRDQLHRDRPQDARAWPHVVPSAPVRLGELRHLGRHHSGHARHRHHLAAGLRRKSAAFRHLQSRAGRRSGALPAPLLVLLAPRRLHHDPARHGRDQRADLLLLAAARLRLRLRGVLHDRDRRPGLLGVGAPHVHHRAVHVSGRRLFGDQLPGRGAFGDQGLQLDRDDL
jgi:hypothetical protein